MKKSIVLFSCLVIANAMAANAFASNCEGVSTALSDAERVAYAPVIEQHLNAQLAPDVQHSIKIQPKDILKVMRAGGWQIIKVDAHINADPYLFYRSGPLQSTEYKSIFASKVEPNEAEEVVQWQQLHINAVPAELKACFAWQVTQSSNS